MSLRLKSIHVPADPEDGMRICVMRRIKEHFEFDMWLPVVAPSHKLLNAYNAGEVTWEEYIPRFEAEVLTNPAKLPYLVMLKELARENTVTLLCHEGAEEHCHRHLLIAKMNEL